MPEQVALTVNGRRVNVPAGACVAAAIVAAGITHTRRSITHQPRGPLCGMGICFECRATINGAPHQRTCNVPAVAGMEVITDG